jgi:hypothetical protein
MFICHAGVLVLECDEFHTRIFCLVLAGNYTMSEALEFAVALSNVLLKAFDTVMSKL